MLPKGNYTTSIGERIIAQCAGLDLLLLLNVSESRHRQEMASAHATAQQAAEWFVAALAEADTWRRASHHRGETIERQADIITDLRARLAEALAVADAANRDASAATKAMEAAACFSGRLRGLLLAVDDGSQGEVGTDRYIYEVSQALADEIGALAIEMRGDTTGRMEKSNNGDIPL